ncbi:MAG: deoxyguanosinetriphosphate triphosphohydrolase [Rhodospirillaceae bacterium]|jgi:dGTPase|nr:deoxyguanosinetriphosphate triphosphohydrolase [Rhodospirillaceae bacterium]|tara:strand:- start:7109 stop:8302 length:1194 start_codon:yes stop_codon:yes gene_type:complete
MTEAPKSAPGLAPYACFEEASRGRLHDEAESATRRCFHRDRDRIIHSAAFRRLEYKTQVFVNHEGDNYRTRLTHTLEVSQITRSLCRSLELNEDLGEALALAHDLGHPPFGHAGEDALREMMEPFGGFDHNAQSLSVITKLEQRYANFDGLNLTWETLEGVVKHNGPLVGGEKDKPLPRVIAGYAREHDLELDTFAGAEAQVAALSDDIAYNNHDIDDGLRAGLFTIRGLDGVALVGPIFESVDKDYPDLDDSRKIHEAVRRLIGAMVEDVLAETRRRIEDAKVASAEDIRALGRPVVGFSAAMESREKAVKTFLFDNMYRHEKLNAMTEKARHIVRDLFDFFRKQPENLPSDWRRRLEGAGPEPAAQVVADYIAGMTDRFAIDEHRRHCEGGARTP